MDGFSLIFGSFTLAVVAAVVAAALGASTPIIWVVGICAVLGMGWVFIREGT
jgi:hypothetical protein